MSILKEDAEIDALDLKELHEGAAGITPRFGAVLSEAASVCLDDQQTGNPVNMELSGSIMGNINVGWDVPTLQAKRCYADLEVATEHGAYGIAALLIRHFSDCEVVERSRKGTGFDYWIGEKGGDDKLFQRKARLEVSGIRKGTIGDIESRVRRKQEQTKRTAGTIPAIVAVVEFGRPHARLVEEA
uniref:Uncharacterized protein n=1 Tax=Candidatus Kentrum sp. DK TaxID=2126562 RepID=A0A450S7C7_9GAMM|nr:MAG: hypothetical protein BECKDK2373C_GA0170839_101926 [Candidatus Kentron sp. DK]